MSLQTSAIHFRGLNAMRFIAAFSIMLYHATLSFQENMPAAVKMWLHNLPVGVDLFFIISGFLIVYLLLKEKEHTNNITLGNFYMRRILRIFPLYFLVIAISFLKYRADTSIDFSKFLYFWGNFYLINKGTWTVAPLNPLWSLCIEEHFYLFIPLLLLITPKRFIPLLFGGIIALSVSFRAYTTLTVQYNWMSIYAHTLSRCDYLAIGGLLAYYYQQKNKHFSIKPIYILYAVVYLWLLMILVDSADFSTLTFAVLKKYLFLAPLLVIFIGVVLNTQSNSFLEFIKQNKVIDYLGKISFGLYMYHSFFEVNNNVLLTNIPLGLQPLGVFLLTILTASVSFELFEKQILKLKSFFEVLKTKN